MRKCFGNLPLIEIRKVDAYRNNIMEKKGHSNHFNNRAHRKVKQHLDLPQTVNHMGTPFHYHRSRDKPPSIIPRPTTKWLDHLRLVNKICKVRLHNHQALEKKNHGTDHPCQNYKQNLKNVLFFP